MSEEIEDIEDRGGQCELAALGRKLEHVLEPAMRRALVRERLLALSPDEAYGLLHAVLSARPGPGSASPVLDDCVYAVVSGAGAEDEDTLPYAFRRELYALAAAAGDDAVARVLRSAAPLEMVEDPDRLLPRELREIPLGRRRSLARGEDPTCLEQLALDPDPVVITHLLANPRTTESDVVRIAALRPVAASTLSEIAQTPRWSTRPRVKQALARNPYTPVEVALRMVGQLPLEGLKTMRSDPDLHPEVLRHVESELARRLIG